MIVSLDLASTDLQVVGVSGVVEELEHEEADSKLPVDSTRAESLDALAIDVFVLVEDDDPFGDVDLFAD